MARRRSWLIQADCALDDPALGRDDEAKRVGALDDRQFPRSRRFGGALRLRPMAAGVGGANGATSAHSASAGSLG
jgi:hypothetical protein